MADQSEEKTLPASDKKLRDARRKGQVPHSKDIVSALTFVAAIGYVLLAWAEIADQLRRLLDVVATAAARPFPDVAAPALALAVDIVLRSSLVLGAFGPVLAFEPLQPKLERINPAEGLKRLFSVKSLVEFLKTLLKLLIVAPILWLVLRGTVQAFFETPACGSGCFGPLLRAALAALARTAAVCFVGFGLLDLILQRRLFMREMRMTQTEAKREHKNMEGDPHIRHEQQRLRRRLMAGSARIGLRYATFAVVYRQQIVALRFQQGEMSAPHVVAKGRGGNGTMMIAETRQRGIAIAEDANLVASLYRQDIGTPIQVGLFGPVAAAMRRTGVLDGG
jgi:type III secretion protein U